MYKTTPRSERKIAMAVINVSDADFEEKVLKSPVPVVVDASTSWCPPCKMFKPVFERASEERSGIVFASFDITAPTLFAGNYGIESVPSLLVFKNGECVKRTVGYLDRGQLDEFLSDIR